MISAEFDHAQPEGVDNLSIADEAVDNVLERDIGFGIIILSFFFLLLGKTLISIVRRPLLCFVTLRSS